MRVCVQRPVAIGAALGVSVVECLCDSVCRICDLLNIVVAVNRRHCDCAHCGFLLLSISYS